MRLNRIVRIAILGMKFRERVEKGRMKYRNLIYILTAIRGCFFSDVIFCQEQPNVSSVLADSIKVTASINNFYPNNSIFTFEVCNMSSNAIFLDTNNVTYGRSKTDTSLDIRMIANSDHYNNSKITLLRIKPNDSIYKSLILDGKYEKFVFHFVYLKEPELDQIAGPNKMEVNQELYILKVSSSFVSNYKW